MMKEKERIRTVGRLLRDACSSLRILRTLEWPPAVKRAFFRARARELPRVEYAPFDPALAIEAVREARRHLVPTGTIDSFLERQARAIELGALMRARAGSPAFFEYGRQLYGEPTAPLRYAPLTPLELAEAVRATIDALAKVEVEASLPATHTAEDVAEHLRAATAEHFGEHAPEVEIVDTLSANALATSRRIRVRRDARFTARDLLQLLHHEAFVHVATALNGQAQEDLPFLASGHPGTTRTQEGLAVFAEIVSGAMELDRLRRLADRVLAIHMAIEGADFLQVYRFFLERTGNEDQAFENARRVFRGGLLEGSAPFTKDVVYLFGLLQVNNFVRACFGAGRADCLRILFCGKLDLADVPALCELHAMGLCRGPRFVPPWIAAPGYLLSLLTFASFTNRIELAPLVDAAHRLLDAAPRIAQQAR